jgi:SAM-dependent methyltransferase
MLKDRDMATSSIAILEDYLAPGMKIYLDREHLLPTCGIPAYSESMTANSYFFGHPIWGRETSHRHETFRARWLAATGSWDDRIVVDIGCGPGNLYATIGGAPKLLIGVDISPGALDLAERGGYTPLLADAQNLPLADSCADLVVANATIHHCDDMARVLDKDPQATALNLSGLGLFLREIRFFLYWIMRSKYYLSVAYRRARQATETHNRQPGDGIVPQVYYETLVPLGFDVRVFPHNHDLGVEVFTGQIGRMSWKRRLAQRLSGIDPDTPAAAQSLMCIARKLAADPLPPNSS